MGKYLKRPSRPAAIALTVIALILAATAYAFVSLNKNATSADAGAPPSPSLPPSSAQPSGNTQNFASSSPAATGCSHPVPLRQASGAWMADYNDDKQNTSAIPDGAGEFSLLDFDWLTFTTPGTLAQSDPFAQPLSSVLPADAQTNPCTLRFVTINDSSTPKRVMAEILTQPSVMTEHVAAIAEEMAGLPYATGLTLDYEFALPYTQADLATYAQVAGLHNLSLDQEVNQLTLDYTRLVQMTAAAMHNQHRLLRVAALVRNNDMVDSEQDNVAPYLFDYGQLAASADQLVLMAIDFHFSGGSPGPIAPLSDVTQVASYVRSYGIPLTKLAIEVANYSYDWPVTADGANATSKSGQVIQAEQRNPTQLAAAMEAGGWRRLGTRDGETQYGYTATASGKQVQHIVWDAATALSYEKAQLAKVLPGVPINIWQIGNNDPVGTALAAQVKLNIQPSIY
jgi:Glycosyl hydrolases family 18